MHTIGKNGDGTWWVARQEIAAGGSGRIALLFDKLSFTSALRLCNCLNGGREEYGGETLKVLEMCAT